MTDKEIFEKYCDNNHLNKTMPLVFKENVQSTFSYKVFALKCAIADLKSELKSTLAEIRLRIKGVVW